MSEKKKVYRLQYLDWLRGAAAIIMLQGHVFHSFLRSDLREGSAYVLSQFLGGMPPAVFLFLTGVTLSFMMDSAERKNSPLAIRFTTALRRAGYLFVLAFAFRFQLWLFGQPDAPWTDMLKVDILNAMGFSMLVMAPMALFRTHERVRLCAILGVAIATASPLISQVNWSGVPELVRNYIVPDYSHFSFFPWASYLAFGLSAGSLIRILSADSIDRAMQWCAIVGGGVLLAAQYFASLPYSLYPKSDFWLDSPAQVLSKQAVIFLVLPFIYLWTRYGSGEGWSWVRQFGATSLLVYWVHIELVYGRWLWFLKTSLDVGQTVLAAVVVILLMLLLSLIQTNRKRLSGALAGLRWQLFPPPDRVPGD